MKTTAIAIFILIFISLPADRRVSAQTVTAKYTALRGQDPFAGRGTPISMAILRFDGDALLDISLFNTLKQDTSVLRRFTIFPYNVLQAQFRVLHIYSLNPKDPQTLKTLKSQLGIELVVTGKKLNDGFELQILTTDGNTVYRNAYLNSRSSTAMDDAVKLFSSSVKTEYIDLGSINWVLVNGGTFQMGNEDGYSDEKPVHTVRVKSFYMSASEITFDQFEAFCRAIGRTPPSDSGWGRANMPVFSVGWDDATSYCRWLSGQLGESIRLPTEVEYEYAARGGEKAHGYRYSGSSYIDDVGWFVGNSKGRPHLVGSRMPNELGIYDLTGNVWEWCSDWYHPTYEGAPASDSSWNVQNPNTPYHVVRGGSWNSSSYNCRVSVRNDGTPTGWVNTAGFRLVREIR